MPSTEKRRFKSPTLELHITEEIWQKQEVR